MSMSIEYCCAILQTGKINFPLKIDFKIRCHLETEMKKLFESQKKETAIGVPDAEIIFTKAPFIQYEQFLLDKNFRQYTEMIMISKKLLRMGVQKSPLKKTYEISVGSNSINVEVFGSNRQFDWIGISLVYDKNDKYLTICDSYNIELASKKIKSVALKNFTTRDERIYLALRASYGYTNEMEKLERNDSKLNLKIQLKNSATKKLRLRVWGYSIGKYLYISAKDSLTLQHRTYSVTSQDNDFE